MIATEIHTMPKSSEPAPLLGEWRSPDYCPTCGNLDHWTEYAYGKWHCAWCTPRPGQKKPKPDDAGLFSPAETASAWPPQWMPPKPVGPALRAAQGHCEQSPPRSGTKGIRCRTDGCNNRVTEARAAVCRHKGEPATCTDCAAWARGAAVGRPQPGKGLGA